jgi:adenosylcobinamide-phosphate synthase
MFELIAAFLLDLKFGDPVYPYHPARLMGHAVENGEAFLRSRIADEKKAGAVLAFGLPAVVLILSMAVIAVLGRIHPFLGFAAAVFGIYSSLSVRDLNQEGRRVLQDLRFKDLPAARKNVARIVGRDTENLDAKEITRAAVEAVSESTVDGIITPLFFAALGGAPLALAYKAVNTLDSMIGHKNEKYLHFGYFAAKQDEAWNWLSARLSYFCIALASLIVNGRAKEALFAGWQDGMAAPYGNSAIPEASFAGALGVKLGGPSTYQGKLVEKPFLGFEKKELEAGDLEKSLDLMMVTSWISLAAALLIHGALGSVFHG